ncbi:BN159_2729 family protein [Streptomyces sp. NPDC058642]|uniref:BN159_2729 family protein n=1 Tax=Streptomyces sp. NPDC058642 TaxID=3346572 RepID=UPI00364B16C8
MNKNFPHAVKVVREAIASSGSDPAAAIVHALGAAGLMVDPEKTYGMVQRRPVNDGQCELQEQPERTELEAQALAWDASCQRARRVAAAIEQHISDHPAFQNVQVDGDRVLVALHIVDQVQQWGEWRRYFGITHDKETALPYMVAGDGYRDGVRVSVVAYDLPVARKLALKIAKEPFEFEGIVYDLALPQRDDRGDVWFYQGLRTADGMPLLSIDGRPERCTLANLARQAGPLTAVTDTPSPQVNPVMTGGATA